jgi:hypothetical protein
MIKVKIIKWVICLVVMCGLAGTLWAMGGKQKAEGRGQKTEVTKAKSEEKKSKLAKPKKSKLAKGKVKGQKVTKTVRKAQKREEVFATKKGQKETQLEKYVKKEIIFIPWGSGNGEIGLKVKEICVQGIATKTVRYGPSKLEVDKYGNLFILDEINKKIHKYSKDKRRLSHFSISKTRKEPILIDKLRNKYEFYKETGDRLGIKILDNSDKLIGKIKFESLDDYLTWATYILGEDKEKNIYILIDNTDAGAAGPREWRLEVHKYSKEGKFLGKVELCKEIDYTYRYDGQKSRIKIDQYGNIYQLLPKEDGVHILKWEVK